jgi:formate hydrogenlyase subunit 3/multisubunit Na+/H+ antiporter MnhD subunit
MSLPGPVFIIGVPLLAAALLQLLRRWTTVVAWFAAGVAGLLAGMIAFIPADQTISIGPLSVSLSAPISVFGRLLVVEDVDRLPLIFITATAAGLFIVAWRLLPHSNFFPSGLIIVALLSGALMVAQVVYAALLVEMAAVMTVFPLHEPLQEGELQSDDLKKKGGLQYMVYATLALPGLMVTQLLLEQFAIFPSDQGLLQTATILLGVSLAILLGAVPFQSWLSSVAMDGSPPVVTFLFTVNIGTVWFLLLAYLESYTWLSQQAAFGSLFTSVGLLMMIMGGALAASQRRLGRLVGYATLVDNGAMFVALGSGQVAGLALSLVVLIARPFALSLMTLGLDGLRHFGDGDDQLDVVAGAAWVVPWRSLAFMVGGVAMAGFPLSLGFSARWGLYRLMVQENLFQALVALIGSAGIMMGLISAVRVLLTPPESEKVRTSVPEDRIVLLLILVLLLGTLTLGLFPQVVSQVALQAAEAFTFFVR